MWGEQYARWQRRYKKPADETQKLLKEQRHPSDELKTVARARSARAFLRHPGLPQWRYCFRRDMCQAYAQCPEYTDIAGRAMIRFVNHKNFNHRTAIGEFPEFAWTDYEETFYKAYCSHLIAHPDLKESPEQFEAYLKEKCVSAKKIDPDMFDVGLPETVCGVAAIRRDYKEYNNSILKLLIESLSDLIYSFRA